MLRYLVLMYQIMSVCLLSLLDLYYFVVCERNPVSVVSLRFLQTRVVF